MAQLTSLQRNMILMLGRDPLLKRIANHQKRLEPLMAKLKEVNDMLKEGCDRTCGYVERKSEYIPGGYLDTAYTMHWETCSVCGYYKKLPPENHGTYG